ncbi:MAG: universal stress protein [Methylophaga sp.]|nr:universal stress protein [Methylophaga sp.]
MTKVIACIDGSKAATAVCDAAAWASQQLNAPVQLLHVLDKTEYPTQEQHSNLSGNIGLGSRENLLEELVELDEKRSKLALEHGKHLLQDAKQRVESDGVADVSIHQRHGSLMETLAEMEADMRVLVMGRQGEAHDTESHAIGSHLENVVRTLHKPILVVLPEFRAPQNFMLAYDGSTTAKKALAKVADSPLLKNLPCHLVMVADNTPQLEADLSDAATLMRNAGFDVTTAMRSGSVQPTLQQYQQQNAIDLMVMGAYGHSRIRQFLVGSNTAKMVRLSDIPLLLLR